MFQYDGHITKGDEDITMWEAATRTWNAIRNKAQAWECKCSSHFSGLTCETPGKCYL